ncbi:MAG: tetratricopeptide repeat protein [Bacteroidales bacterium]|nr:tetratricopeptide repeat protein [Bacteroidales bacterium]
MINSLLTFGAKSVDPKILEQTLTVRAEIVNEIEKNCVNKTKKSTTWQSLVIAPRGSGKTHLIKVLYHRLKQNKEISNKSVIAYMSEDEVGIANFTDLMVSIIRAFVRYGESGSETLESQISEASLIKDLDKRTIFVKDILLNFAKKRIVILLIENFDKILKALDSQGERSLRDFIHLYNNLTIIATSQNLIANLQDSKNPFYNFFNISQLEKLNFEETVKFLGVIAKTEGNNELASEIKKNELEGKLKAIYELTEGNHRLLVTFYSFLKADFKSELSGIFIKVMNDLKPYYEQFINDLPPQQQKIVKHLSLNRGAISGKEIAVACFIEPNVISKQFSLLFEKGMIDKNKSGKDVYYELKEPLMRICFEISENPNGISSLFVDFLSAYYDGKILKEQYLKFKYGARFQCEEIKGKYENEAMMYGLVLSELEREKISFAHKAFTKIDNYTELENIINSSDKGALKQIDSSYENFKKGNDLIEENKLEEAVVYYKKSASLYPENDNLFYKMGLAFFNLKQYKEAVEALQKAVELSPINEGAYFRLGSAFFNLEQYKETIEAFQKTVELNPKNEVAYFGLGSVFLNLKQYKAAIEAFQKAIELGLDNEAAYDGLGIAYLALKQFREAINVFQKYVELNSGNEKVFRGLGLAFISLELYEEAIEAFQKVVKLNPEDVEVFQVMGIAYSNLKQYKETIGAYKKVVELNPKNEFAFYGLGDAFQNLKQYKEAIKAYQKSVEFNPKNEDAYNSLGISFLSIEQYKEAIEAFQNAVELNPRNEGVYLGLGLAFLSLEQYKEAIEAFQNAVELNPRNEDAYYRLGISFFNVEQYKEAVEAIQNAVELNPKNATYFNSLGSVFSNMKQYEEAIQSYQKAIKIKPEKDELFNGLGLAYLEVGDIDNAFETFNKGLELNAENMYTNFSLLGANVRINDQNKSKELLVKLIKKVDDDLLMFSLTDDIFYNLFRFGSEEFIKSYFGFIIKLLLKEKKDEQLWKSLPDSLFNILINIEDYESERLSNIEKTLTERLAEYKESVIPLKMFRIGVSYLKNKEKNDIFKLSKEERKLFKEAVLDERESISKANKAQRSHEL